MLYNNSEDAFQLCLLDLEIALPALYSFSREPEGHMLPHVKAPNPDTVSALQQMTVTVYSSSVFT